MHIDVVSQLHGRQVPDAESVLQSAADKATAVGGGQQGTVALRGLDLTVQFGDGLQGREVHHHHAALLGHKVVPGSHSIVSIFMYIKIL